MTMLQIVYFRRFPRSVFPDRGHRFRGRHTPAHDNATNAKAEGCTIMSATAISGADDEIDDFRRRAQTDLAASSLQQQFACHMSSFESAVHLGRLGEREDAFDRHLEPAFGDPCRQCATPAFHSGEPWST